MMCLHPIARNIGTQGGPVSRLRRSDLSCPLTQRFPIPARENRACREPWPRWANVSTRLPALA